MFTREIKSRIILIALFLAIGPVSSAANSIGGVPLVRILATPSDFSGVTLATSGVMQVNDQGVVALYLDSGSMKAGVSINSIALLVSPEQFETAKALSGRYVLVRGVFDAERPLPRGRSGLIREVEYVRGYPLISPLP